MQPGFLYNQPSSMQNMYNPQSILQRPFQTNYLNQHGHFQHYQPEYQPQNEVEPICSIHHTDTIHFYADKVELTINVNQRKAENLRVNILTDKIEFVSNDPIDRTQYNMVTSRIFLLPQKIIPSQSFCHISNDGILNISSPWDFE